MNENQPHKVHLVSLGCPKNTVDSERMLGLLQGHAYQMTDAPEEADVVVVNTCGFIEPAKEESLAAIMDAHRLKQEGSVRGGDCHWVSIDALLRGVSAGVGGGRQAADDR